MGQFGVEDLGLMSYADAYARQLAVHAEVVDGGADRILVVQHPPVITLGAGYHEENLVLAREAYAARGIEVERTDRGGDVTYHGPGQLVAYPILRLDPFDRDLHRYLRFLEECVIHTCARFGLAAGRNPVNTGVWVGNRKICAMGIKVRRWVSFHGLALNCDVDLANFGTIVPCGIRGAYGVTSLTQELGRPVTVDEARDPLVDAFAELHPSRTMDA